MKTKLLLKYCFIMLCVTFMSCEGEDGIDGEQGPAGEDGNANVIVRTVNPFPTWETGSYLGIDANTVNINEPLLDNNMVENALVLVYFELSFESGQWHPMTYSITYDYFDNISSEVITFTYEEGNIDIYAFSEDGPLYAAISKIKYFIIPANEANGSLENIGVDINNYESVAEYFGTL